MSARPIRTLTEWKEHCAAVRRANSSSSSAILRTAWAASEITPPPSLESPTARLPMERAADLERQADHADSEAEKARLLREAFRWLDCPHPDSSPSLRRAIARRKNALVDRIHGLDSVRSGG
ncbi:MAG: hypothetical protein R3324_01035 [Halobacteriales archaeon]|nr:hypothetical protein [Halobacteriales archaeon]